jgi:ParB-like chromosome segregation protein Spo0J/DNA modification methylase
MLFLPLADITISPERQRQEFDPEALEELGTSIQKLGLLHPVVVRDSGEGKYRLVAGERRLRAITQIYDLWEDVIRCNNESVPFRHVPCLTLGELNPLDAEEAELDENLRRKDLTWQEHAAALKRLQLLRTAQIAHATGDKLPESQVVTRLATEVLGRSDGAFRDAIRKELIVADHLDNPDVAKAPTVAEAFKVLKQQEQRTKNQALAAEVGKSLSSASHTCLHGDALDLLLADPAFQGKFDVICSDPPYGMNAHQFGDAAGRMSAGSGITHQYDDTYENWKRLMNSLVPVLFAVAKPQAHMYLFCDFDRFHELKRICEEVGWYVFRTPLVYVKTGGGRVPLPEMGPRRCYELCLYAVKGKKPVTHIYPDVVQAGADANESHGAQKSVAVFQNLLQRSVSPGNQILDPCAGTGTLALAAHILKCRATCIEQSAEYFGVLVKRVQSL